MAARSMMGEPVSRPFSARRWLNEQRRFGQIAWTRHEATPWLYPMNHPGYARDWSYTLVQFHGGFRTRIYDWEMS